MRARHKVTPPWLIRGTPINSARPLSIFSTPPSRQRRDSAMFAPPLQNHAMGGVSNASDRQGASLRLFLNPSRSLPYRLSMATNWRESDLMGIYAIFV